MSKQHKYLLDESRLPKAWYNINADLPFEPTPVLHPQTLEPVTPTLHEDVHEVATTPASDRHVYANTYSPSI